MRCRFGTTEVGATLTSAPGEWINPYSHTKMACAVPPPTERTAHSVPFQLSLNGQEWSANLTFRFYRHPKISSVSPARVSAHATQLVTLTRSAGVDSGPWVAAGLSSPAYKVALRFEPSTATLATVTLRLEPSTASFATLACAAPATSVA